MKRVTKILLFGLLALSLLWSGLSTLYARELSQELTYLRRENRSDTVYLRNRVKELESEIKERLRLPIQAVGGNPSDDSGTDDEETTPMAETDTSDPVGEETEKVSDAVTEEAHRSHLRSSQQTGPHLLKPTASQTIYQHHVLPILW